MTQHFPSLVLAKKVSLLGGLGVLGALAWTGTATATGSLVIPEATPVNTAPSAVEPTKVPLAAPQVSVPAPTIKTPTAVTPSTGSPSAMAGTQGGKNSYIDTNNYGSPVTTAKPATVVLKERTTGCQTVVSNGQLQSGSCSVSKQPVSPPASALPPRPVATRQSAPAVTQARASQSKAVSRSTVAATVTKPEYYRAAARSITSQGDGDTALLFPLSIPATISSVFGWRIHPITGVHSMHHGTDLAAPTGTPVLATYPGEVAITDSLGGYGLTVVLRHERGTQESRYAHLSEILVNSGDWVEQGDVIGLVGSTGRSTGAHLHFEWRHLTNSGWVAVDAGLHLEYAMANLIDSLELAQSE